MSNEIPSAVRRKVRERDGGQCLRCGVPGTEIQHRVRRREGGHALWNLVLMCHHCHQTWAHANPAAARDTGWIVSVHHPEPWTVPVKTFFGWALLTEDGQIVACPAPGATILRTG